MADLQHCTAAILVGGLGTRLRSVVADRPKILAEVRGKPFLTYLLDQLVESGCPNTVLCTGYLGEQVSATFGDSYRNMRLLYSQELSQLGTGGALRLALPLLESDCVLAMNGDSFCHTKLSDFWAWHIAQGAEATLLLTHVSDTKRYGRVQVEPSGQVQRFEEKGDTQGAGWINAGLYLLNRQRLATIPAGKPISLERDIFPMWIDRGLYGYRSQGRFLDIGTPESYAMANEFFAPETL